MNKLLKGALSIDGCIDANNLAIQLCYLEMLKSNFSLFSTLEIGVYKGRTAYMPIQLGAHHTGVDFSTSLEETPQFSIIYKDSKLLSEQDVLPLYGRVGFMLIDGEHSRQAVYSDLMWASKLLSDKGILCLDDTSYSHPGINEALQDFLQQHPDVFQKIAVTDSETFLCRAGMWEDYYNFTLFKLPQKFYEYLGDESHLKIYSGDSFEPSSFISHPFLRFEFNSLKHIEYIGKQPYYNDPNTFVVLKRKNLSYLDKE